MWLLINGFQLIYLSLALNLYYTVPMKVMFGYLAILNMENSLVANLFMV